VQVINDACHLLLTHLHHSNVFNNGDQPKIENFLKTFISTFFGLDRESFQKRMSDVNSDSPPNEEAEDDLLSEEAAIQRGRRAINGKKGNLLRGVLERGQHSKQGRKEKESSSALESKESTPDVTSMDDESVTPADTPSEQPSRFDSAEHRWMDHPTQSNSQSRGNVSFNEPFPRDSYSLYANLNIYCFMRMFQLLYERLAHIKENERQVHVSVQRAKAHKPAIDLKLADKSPSEFFTDTSPTANYYQQMLKRFEDQIRNEDDMVHIEETLRRFYMAHGWGLYNFDRILIAIIRFAGQVVASDNKDKSNEIISLFYKNRKDHETTHQNELEYRKSVEKLVRDGDIYRFEYVSRKEPEKP
jgi:paired amphipathic helix protein Sin3a